MKILQEIGLIFLIFYILVWRDRFVVACIILFAPKSWIREGFNRIIKEMK